jgi:hypothetical protein
MQIGLRGARAWLAGFLACAVLGPGVAQAQSSVPESQLETFLGLSTGGGLNSGALTGLGNGPVMNGSAIMQSITVSAGDTLSFEYNFLTNAPSPATVGFLNAIDPFAFYTAPALTDFADNYSSLGAAPSQSGFLYQTGYTPISVTFMTAGTYSFGIGLADVTTDQYSSALEVTNFALSSGSLTNGSFGTGDFTGWSTIGDTSVIPMPSGLGASGLSYQALISTASVPEPSSILMLLTGGFGAAFAIRHMARATPSRRAV